jgi:hypothetical protein
VRFYIDTAPISIHAPDQQIKTRSTTSTRPGDDDAALPAPLSPARRSRCP